MCSRFRLEEFLGLPAFPIHFRLSVMMTSPIRSHRSSSTKTQVTDKSHFKVFIPKLKALWSEVSVLGTRGTCL